MKAKLREVLLNLDAMETAEAAYRAAAAEMKEALGQIKARIQAAKEADKARREELENELYSTPREELARLLPELERAQTAVSRYTLGGNAEANRLQRRIDNLNELIASTPPTPEEKELAQLRQGRPQSPTEEEQSEFEEQHTETKKAARALVTAQRACKDSVVSLQYALGELRKQVANNSAAVMCSRWTAAAKEDFERLCR